MVFRQAGYMARILAVLMVIVSAFWATLAIARVNEDLIEAANRSDLPAIEGCIAKGADVNAKTNQGVTVLVGVCMRGHKDVVDVLLAKGADVNFKDNDGVTALMCASGKGHEEVVQWLLANGAAPNVR
jgi:ankyrin repeat protein